MRVGWPCREAVRDGVRSEEAYCRFCEMQLPDWTSAYAAMPRGKPLMTISHNGRIFLITGKPHVSGLRAAPLLGFTLTEEMIFSCHC